MADGTTKSVESICSRTTLGSHQAQAQTPAQIQTVIVEMAGSIAHEVNNPLAALQLCLENLEATIKQTEGSIPGLLPHIKQALKMVERISRIVKGLRALSHNENCEAPESVRLGDLIEDTLELCEKRLSTQSIRLDLSLNDNLILNCRKVQITQILVNLLNNSCDALSTIPANNRWIRIESLEKGDLIEIAVIDGGPGPAIETRNKLFQPFYTTKTLELGTGLGLHISRSIAENHSGSLIFDAESTSCRFVLTLPSSLLEQKDSVEDRIA